MIRRCSHFTALCTGALFLGTLLGVATDLPRAHAKIASTAQADQAPVKPAPGNAGKGSVGSTCKTSKDCQQSPQALICTQVGDHKECTAPVVELPIAPTVT